jgi:hypothetical protein
MLFQHCNAADAVLHCAPCLQGAAAAAGLPEDLDGFVHMNMIDDLLSGSE